MAFPSPIRMERAFGSSTVLTRCDTRQFAKLASEVSLIGVAEVRGHVGQAGFRLRSKSPGDLVEALNPKVMLRRQTHRRSEQGDEVSWAKAR